MLDIGGAIVQPAAFCGFGDGGGSRVVVLSLTLVGVEKYHGRNIGGDGR